MHYFCTYFDHRYLSRGLSLHESLARYCSEFQLWILCLDDLCFKLLDTLRLPNVHLISLRDFESGDISLQDAKGNRSLVEYYFTCTPSLPLYIFNNWVNIDTITYVDADVFLFSNPEPAFHELGDWSVIIVPHRFPGHLKHLEKYGVYNVGWLTFRRDSRGLTCLTSWRNQCIDWCYDRLEDKRFADQKYLDTWTSDLDGVVVLNHSGVNLAPWNVANFNLHVDRGQVWVDDQPLICFHFHKFKHLEKQVFVSGCADYQVKPSYIMRDHLFTPYVQAIVRATACVNSLLPSSSFVDTGNNSLRLYGHLQNAPMTQWVISRFGKYLPQPVVQYLEKTLHYWEGLITGEYIRIPVKYP